MLKAHKKTLIITSIVTILPILIGLIVWNRLPDTMATHFGMDGQPNGYESKMFAVVGLPLILLAAQWFAAVVTVMDPKKRNISDKMFNLILWIVPLISLVVAVLLYMINLGYDLDVGFFVRLVLGVLFFVIGNFLPKARQNYSIGIKTSWALDNEQNWNRTHRLAGYVFMIGGALIVILTLIGYSSFGFMIVILLAMTLLPFCYSFWLHAKRNL